MNADKSERIEEFLRRLTIAPAARSFAEAWAQINDVLNEVEDELTTIPFNPDHWQSDGRLYPPQMDSIRDVPGYADVKRFRSRQHNTYVRENGAMEIQSLPSNEMVFAKAGEDGKGVWDR